MGRAKIKKKDTFIDMTAMSDVWLTRKEKYL